MDELKIVKLAELRSRMAGIPVKLLIAFLIVAGAMCRFHMDTFKEDILKYVVAFLAIYGILSYFWLLIKMTGNWLVGIIVAVALIFVWQYYMEKIGEVWNTVIGAVVCFGGPVLDLFATLRYFFLKKQLFSQMEDDAEYEDYGDEDEEEYEEDDEVYEEEYEEDDEAYEEYQRQQTGREWRERRMQDRKRSEAASPGFFSGCKDAASIKRRYRDLCKVYHPDAGNGSSEVFHKITEEYNRLIKDA